MRHHLAEWVGIIFATVRHPPEQWLTAEQTRTVIAVASVAITGIGIFVSQQIAVARLEEQMRASAMQLHEQAMARRAIYEERFRQAEIREERHIKEDDDTEREIKRIAGVQAGALRDLDAHERRLSEVERKAERLQMYHQLPLNGGRGR